MAKVCCVLSDRASRLGLYLNRFAAAKTRAWVCSAMVSIPEALFSTTEIVVGDSLRCSARVFRLTRLVLICSSSLTFPSFLHEAWCWRSHRIALSSQVLSSMAVDLASFHLS